MSHVAPIYGLILAGGASRRMHTDKAAIEHDGQTQLQRAHDLLSKICSRTFVSVRPDQVNDPVRKSFPQIVDTLSDVGPLAGISAALAAHPDVAWLIMACDLPFVNETTLKHLISHRDSSKLATAFRSSHDQLPEPLCAIWEPSSAERVREWIANSQKCPRKLLINSNIELINQPQSNSLDNINTPDEMLQALKSMNAATRKLKVQYFALFREQAGKRDETVESVATSPSLLYAELKQRYGFTLEMKQLKVAINNEFADWQTILKADDHVAFIPPVAGG
ncbi:MAG: NTP transferase domain-containing protein [Steroidobacter sp.]